MQGEQERSEDYQDENKMKPRFNILALDIFSKVINLFGNDDTVKISFDPQNNEVRLDGLIMNNQSIIRAILTGKGEKGDILGDLSIFGDGSKNKITLDSKSLKLMLKHASKGGASSMDLEPHEDRIDITCRDRGGNALTKHSVKRIDDSKVSDEEDDGLHNVDEIMDSIDYPCRTFVDGLRLFKSLQISCNETIIERKDQTLQFTTDHTLLKTTMFLPMNMKKTTIAKNSSYKAHFTKLPISLIARAAKVCSDGSKLGKNPSKSRKRPREEDEEDNDCDEDEAFGVELFLCSEDPFGLKGSIGNNSSLTVYCSSKNGSDDDEEEEEGEEDDDDNNED